MVLADTLIYTFPIYPFTETPDNEAAVLLRSEELLRFNKRHGGTFPILLTDNQGGSEPGYPGAKSWIDGLRKLGVAEDDIELIPLKRPDFNTLTEAFNVVEFVMQKGLKDLVIIAPPFHALRCFLSVVTAIRHHNANLRVFMAVGITQPWNEHAVHSQGTTQGKRKDLIIGELRRILKYQSKENRPAPLASADDALAYIVWRDSN